MKIKLNLSILSYHLDDLNPVLCGTFGQALSCQDVRFWDEQTSGNPAFCYLTEWSRISGLSRFFPEKLICVGGGERAALQLAQQAREALVLDPTEIGRLWSRIRDVFVLYDNLDEALTKSILADEPLQALLGRAADFFQNPVRAYDADLALIESSSNYPYAENDPVWKETSSTGIASTNITNRLKSQRRMQALYQSRQAVFIDLGKDFIQSITVNCFGEKERFAFLAFSGRQNRISPLLLGLADHIAERLTPALLKHCEPKFYERSQTDAYISRLLYGQNTDHQIMDARLKNIGWKRNDKYLILRIRLPSMNFDEGVDGYNKRYYASFFHNSQSFVQEDIINLILNISGREETIRPQFDAMGESLIRDGAVCGVSLPFQDFSMLHEQYLLAGVALSFGKSNDAESPYRYYGDCMLPHLLGELSSILPLKALCHEAVLMIQQYDDANESQLVTSLETYLQEERSLVRASKALNIHRNTLVYRLDRISEIMKLDFNDTALRIHILFSCAILQYGKQLRNSPRQAGMERFFLNPPPLTRYEQGHPATQKR